MTFKRIVLLIIFALPLGGLAQGSASKEAQETLRFIRLAETKKRLDFPEDKLLDINELLDQYEADRFALMERRRRMYQRLRDENLHDSEIDPLLEEFAAIKRQEIENQVALYQKARERLNPRETLQFIRFYERFQREVLRKARALKGNKGNRRRGMNNRLPR